MLLSLERFGRDEAQVGLCDCDPGWYGGHWPCRSGLAVEGDCRRGGLTDLHLVFVPGDHPLTVTNA